MFFDADRCIYRKAQLEEVICQLRFPTILSIQSKEPVDFQEAIRGDYPKYLARQDSLPPKVSGRPGGFKIDEQPPTTNYQFLSADGRWKVNLTKDFVSLSTPAYTCWEDFAKRLDKILASFIETYKPAYFERVGLRFINAVSRKALDIEDRPFADLIQPGYIGLLGEDDIEERSFGGMMQNADMSIPGGCRMNLRSGLGMVQKNNVRDKEMRFILDIDIYMVGNIPINHSAASLNTVHINADRVFRGAITKTLHDAMEPDYNG